MEIRLLNTIEFDALANAFIEATADSQSINKEKLESDTLCKRYDSSISFGAFDSDDKLISFTMNGLGDYNDKYCVYDVASRTMPKHRDIDWAKTIFKHSIPHLRAKGVAQYIVEVDSEDKENIDMYTSLGFETSRELQSYRIEKKDIKLDNLSTDFKFYIEKVVNPPVQCSFWDAKPAWQNSFEGICRDYFNFLVIGAYQEGKMIGYAILNPSKGDLVQIAIDRESRRKGAGKALLAQVVKHSKSDTITINNLDAGCESMHHFLEVLGMRKTDSKLELVRKI